MISGGIDTCAKGVSVANSNLVSADVDVFCPYDVNCIFMFLASVLTQYNFTFFNFQCNSQKNVTC